MFVIIKRRGVQILLALLLVVITVLSLYFNNFKAQTALYVVNTEEGKNYIKWVDFSVPYSVLEKTLTLDIKSYGTECKLNWIELLAYLGAKYGGKFDRYKKADLDKVVEKLKQGQSMQEIAGSMKYFNYYMEAYSAVLGGFVGEYESEVDDKDNPGQKKYVTKYGLKVYSPIARGYSFSHYDDFGDSRSYGYKRRHLGNDLMGRIGTPVIAVESGIIEVMGWNMYGGWRVGIRSFDGKRYYYYAHLRKDHPFNNLLKEGQTVKAGEVIGYLGMTGYSTKENVNNIKKPHLHFGLQLIFDESQKEGVNQIWVDVYDIINILQKNKSAVYKDESVKEFKRVYDIKDPAIPVD